ncbi:DNA-binding transcriptional regulator [Streptococcus azizii]|uniref:DNA-binding transcriptional regulator n=1 Tax=Streptococcus azizii TaxID=1579424 RepID=A0AB36JNT3_9STRE|nr:MULTISPECIES: sugar-binding transcriptional regulator [Streptococcus]MBF0776048.1 sugar-binding transcriptional regulator [Streptococcus sp. 19428wD3_AN2]ONK28873.1 DNA-binding transcriptional regulator [Streptococcus azizii]ONK30384.1 DNA-binding transcriptional regulator [Streptococcus azizii]ONK31136.1 DNA-binding transcriptional regulator [Streptococcus azizii]TFU83613.1 sugar-binding transcriptional regulator [Streptococcus sp. AN2]
MGRREIAANNRKQLAKVAYLYYIEGKSQAEVAKELGIYRTTISRMLTRAREKGVVTIEIHEFDTDLFHLEHYVKEKYNLENIEIVSSVASSDKSLEEMMANAGAAMIRGELKNHSNVGISWGKTLSNVVAKMIPRQMKNVHFYPLAGGPSHINARYHVNTLMYELMHKFHGECSFINATIVQESKDLALGIRSSKYFEEIIDNWERLDLAIVGIGGRVDKDNRQWLDMLTDEDFKRMNQSGAVGEICCRFLDAQGREIADDVVDRTIAISLAELGKVPRSIAIAYGDNKVEAMLAVLRQGYITHLVTDYRTILQVLELDGDRSFSSDPDITL